MRGAATRERPAFLATVHKNVAAFGVRLGADGTQGSATAVGTIPRMNVHVERVKAKGAMIARGVAERQNLPTAMRTEKAVIVFCEKCRIHKPSLTYTEFAENARHDVFSHAFSVRFRKGGECTLKLGKRGIQREACAESLLCGGKPLKP